MHWSWPGGRTIAGTGFAALLDCAHLLAMLLPAVVLFFNPSHLFACTRENPSPPFVTRLHESGNTAFPARSSAK
ncbi:MAG: hypothetical protein WCZ18_07565 [Ottowia sp.]|nr:hypothetical protein [Ottowia sp.]